MTYALRTGLISQYDTTWAVNAILEVLKLDSYADPSVDWVDIDLSAVLDELTDDAYARGVLVENSIAHRDLFKTALMGRLTPRPAQVIEKFQALCWEDPQKGIDWYYKFSQDTNYIRRDRIAKDVQWKVPTEYGDLDIAIDLSTPEKDPEFITAAGCLTVSNYPRCQLCLENEGCRPGELSRPTEPPGGACYHQQVVLVFAVFSLRLL